MRILRNRSSSSFVHFTTKQISSYITRIWRSKAGITTLLFIFLPLLITISTRSLIRICQDNEKSSFSSAITQGDDLSLSLEGTTAALTNSSSNSNNSTIMSVATATPNQCFDHHNDDDDSSSPLPIIQEENSTRSNRTLVIIIGSLRGGELAWKSLYRNVLDLNSADLALYIGEIKSPTNTYPRNSSLFQRARYVWQFTEPTDDWSSALRDMVHEMKVNEESLHDVDMLSRMDYILNRSQNHTGLFGPINNRRGSGAIIFLIRYWLSKKIQQLNLTAVYDRFVITRSDHYYQCSHNLSALDNKKLWTPTGSDYRGITDRHLVVSNRYVLQALDIFPSLFRNPHAYWHILHIANPERLIGAVWNQTCLSPTHHGRFDRIMFTCGDLQGDDTRWRKYGRQVQAGGGTIRLKYGDEYHSANRACRAVKATKKSSLVTAQQAKKTVRKRKKKKTTTTNDKKARIK